MESEAASRARSGQIVVRILITPLTPIEAIAALVTAGIVIPDVVTNQKPTAFPGLFQLAGDERAQTQRRSRPYKISSGISDGNIPLKRK